MKIEEKANIEDTMDIIELLEDKLDSLKQEEEDLQNEINELKAKSISKESV